jgi:hypothetical protein
MLKYMIWDTGRGLFKSCRPLAVFYVTIPKEMIFKNSLILMNNMIQCRRTQAASRTEPGSEQVFLCRLARSRSLSLSLYIYIYIYIFFSRSAVSYMCCK